MWESFLARNMFSIGGTVQTSDELACWMSDCLKAGLVQGITSAAVGSVVESQPMLIGSPLSWDTCRHIDQVGGFNIHDPNLVVS